EASVAARAMVTESWPVSVFWETTGPTSECFAEYALSSFSPFFGSCPYSGRVSVILNHSTGRHRPFHVKPALRSSATALERARQSEGVRSNVTMSFPFGARTWHPFFVGLIFPPCPSTDFRSPLNSFLIYIERSSRQHS